ncbi:MAG: ribonucleoside-triphosphate reductase, adenosylcobalamin-dependent [Deferrisomatales bacterium]
MNESTPFREVRKRDGQVVAFDRGRIARAVRRAMEASGEGDPAADSERVARAVVAELARRAAPGHVPHVEEIQDVVEEVLILQDLPRTAKAYILYRHERARVRAKARAVPEAVRRLARESQRYFPNPLAEFVYYRTYSRWIEAEGRRETWVETVDRYLGFMKEILGGVLSADEYEEVRRAILGHEVMPSMRLLWSAGPAARANQVAAYNCSFLAPRHPEDLAEIMYLLMSGVGVGFSVETKNVQHLPIVAPQGGERLPTHRVADSKEGWADALKAGLRAWYGGQDLDFDFSRVRPAGARLRTMGGRSSGPAPLRGLLDYARGKILAAQGRRLRNIDVHDLVCRIGDVVEMGGVRRSALISLSDFDDEEMRRAKTGHFYLTEPQRAMANNSAVYEGKPRATDFLEEWLALARSGTGERGIFNRGALPAQVPSRRWPGFEPHWATAGTNPCGEIVLRSRQFCNLTEVVARPGDTETSLLRKMRLAALLGTYQAMLTDFSYLSPQWRENCEEERLLGVSITGQWDCPAVRRPGTLERLRACAVETNRTYARRFGIRAGTAVTCVKPSGTVSQLVDSASGMHPRFAPYYLRRIRISATDPLLALLRDQKFPCRPEVGQLEDAATTFVLEFPVKAPRGSVTRADLSALDQLEHWRTVRECYTEHNPSVTVLVGAGEWIAVAHWLYEHWDLVGGLSFLPRSGGVYELPPYEEISEAEYRARVESLPTLDFSRIVAYETEDTTKGAREAACLGGACEVDPEEGSPVAAVPPGWPR